MTVGFTNSATVTGTPPVGPSVTDTDTATVSVAGVPPFSTTATHTGTSLLLGSTGAIGDTATVTGNSDGPTPTGTVTFYECGPVLSDQTCNATSTGVSVSEPVTLVDGSAASLTFTPTVAGTYCFGATFTSGDTNYSSATDNTTGDFVACGVPDGDCTATATATAAATAAAATAATTHRPAGITLAKSPSPDHVQRSWPDDHHHLRDHELGGRCPGLRPSTR